MPVHACLAIMCVCVHVSVSPPAAPCLGLQLSAQRRQAEKFCNLKELLLQTSVLPLKAHERQAACEQPKPSSGRKTSFYAPPALSCDTCDLLRSPGRWGLKGCYCTGGCEGLRGLAAWEGAWLEPRSCWRHVPHTPCRRESRHMPALAPRASCLGVRGGRVAGPPGTALTPILPALAFCRDQQLQPQFPPWQVRAGLCTLPGAGWLAPSLCHARLAPK